jgi:uncharacterized protein
MTTAAAVTAIGFYQQFISPYKGFRCAHRVKHGRMSCSQFAKRLIEKVGLMRFAPIFRKRLRRCGDAAAALKIAPVIPYRAKADDQDDADRASKPNDSACNGCDVVPDMSGCDLSGAADGCGSVADAGACDAASGCDAGGCDFSV